MEEIMPKNLKRAKLVKTFREERAWSQSQLATIADVNIRTIQRVEKDGTASFDTLMGIAQAFGVDIKELNTTSASSKEKDSPQRTIHHLPRLITGKNLYDVISYSDQFQFEHDEPYDQRSLSFMKAIMNEIQLDVVRLYDADPLERLTIESELTKALKDIEGVGFYLFGIKRVIPRISGKQKVNIAMCTLFMSHSKSPKIIRDKRMNMVIPALLSESTI